MAEANNLGLEDPIYKYLRFYAVEGAYILFQNTLLNPFERLKALKQLKTVITPYGINPNNSSFRNFLGSGC